MDGPLPITVVLTAGLERLPTVAAAPIRLPEAVNKGVDPLARPRPWVRPSPDIVWKMNHLKLFLKRQKNSFGVIHKLRLQQGGEVGGYEMSTLLNEYHNLIQ